MKGMKIKSTTPKNRFSKYVSRSVWPSSKLYKDRALFISLVVCAVGAIVVISTHAQTATIALEAEGGTLTGNAQAITSDSTASNGGYVKFKAPQTGGLNPGQQINASNTGFVGAGLTDASLTSGGASVTYSTDGQTYSGKSYTASSGDYSRAVIISGNNITLKNCKIVVGGTNKPMGIQITGDNVTIQNCTISSPKGKSSYEPIIIENSADNVKLLNNDVSGGENVVTSRGTNVTMSKNYIHDPSLASNPNGHIDAIEVYEGGNVIIDSNRIEELNAEDAPINMKPDNGTALTNVTITNNFIDGGQHNILIDTSENPIRTVRVTSNVMGGHQVYFAEGASYGHYHSLYNQTVAVVQTEAQLAANPNAVLWPTSGAAVNYWGESEDLVPNKNGQIVIPAD